MKPLIITAGDKASGKFLAEVWLPTLRKNAEYTGDVLLFDYDFSETYRNILRQDKNVFIEKTEPGNIWVTRHRDAYFFLTDSSYSNYDVVLCIDGKDITFQKPIVPLFDLAKEVVCYTIERGLNANWVRIEGPDADKIWEVIKDKRIINGGFYIGPLNEIVKLERFMSEQCKHFPVDQLWLNALIYYHGFPAKRVDDTWNWARSFGVKVIDGVYCTPDGEKVAIYHDH